MNFRLTPFAKYQRMLMKRWPRTSLRTQEGRISFARGIMIKPTSVKLQALNYKH